MECCRVHLLLALASLLFSLPVVVHGWGVDGHYTVCKIAQTKLTDAAAAAVKELLPAHAENDLGSLCSWADVVKRPKRPDEDERPYYPWSYPLHFVNTRRGPALPGYCNPGYCNYSYDRDCKDREDNKGVCVVAAIHNYTNQLLDYGKAYTKHNLTEALLFLSHFVGDMHQPLHEGYVEDQGGNKIKLYWYDEPSNLHKVWDVNITNRAKEMFYGNKVQGLIETIQTAIKEEGWASKVKEWENSCGKEIKCPDLYASEGIDIACKWAYKDATPEGCPVKEGSKLGDDYFIWRFQIVYEQLAKGGVRLASILNKVFVPLENVN